MAALMIKYQISASYMNNCNLYINNLFAISSHIQDNCNFKNPPYFRVL